VSVVRANLAVARYEYNAPAGWPMPVMLA